jgi:hypothetical protein
VSRGATGEQGVQGVQGETGPPAAKNRWLRIVAIVGLSIWLAVFSAFLTDAVQTNTQQTKDIAEAVCISAKESRAVFLDGFDALTAETDSPDEVSAYRLILVERLGVSPPVCKLVKENN